MRRRQGRVAVVVIWALVLVGAFLLATKTNDPTGAGVLAFVVGTALTSFYFFLRRARSLDDLMPTPGNAPVGAATAAWLRVVVMFLLWIAASVILILLRVPDGYAVVRV